MSEEQLTLAPGLQQAFNPEEVEKYCRETPNFEIYYQSLCKN